MFTISGVYLLKRLRI
ncbi:MAG: sortase B protein-sorting domain-containing protein [Methanosarcina thermophila]|nr:sortase B protein-sorting domain-containing protein [Methanosarcina thermophila]